MWRVPYLAKSCLVSCALCTRRKSVITDKILSATSGYPLRVESESDRERHLIMTRRRLAPCSPSTACAVQRVLCGRGRFSSFYIVRQWSNVMSYV